MGLRINTNLASMAAQRALAENQRVLEKTYQRMASGKRVVEAGDDAAGLSIGENLHAQVRSMRQAHRNANDGISFVQVAEGGMNEIGNGLIRMRELAIQAASDTVGDREREFINEEFENIIAEIDRVANSTTFIGVPLLNGEADKDDLEFQVGIRNDEADRILFNVTENDVRADALGVEGLSALEIDEARDSLDVIDEAIGRVSGTRARLGAVQNKLHSAANSIAVNVENLSAARSRIIDADYAVETSELTKNNILTSTGVAILGQANSVPAQALKLI